ncbi:MAG TPA: hypothetical protein P5026_11500 [Kiritimatiellia bacterium]|nr:hypothetical protein [Kiritimatiellia bacterium]HRU70411.1 hypothetical protein [Kiritimatiellia bacterium]
MSFLTDERTLLGTGRRRRCHRVPGTDLCAKFYHAPYDLPRGTRLTTRLNIAWGRRYRFANINYREWQYHQRLKRQLPDYMAAVFPEHTEPVYCPQRGWGIIETVILNADGTQPRRVAEELKSLRDPALGRSLYEAVECLSQQLVEYGVRFFDFPNILVQWTGPRTFRLRIADFEPSCRSLIPGLSHVDFYVRCKVRRRATRYLHRLETILNSVSNGHGFPFVRRPQHRSLFRRFALAAGLMM